MAWSADFHMAWSADENSWLVRFRSKTIVVGETEIGNMRNIKNHKYVGLGAFAKIK